MSDVFTRKGSTQFTFNIPNFSQLNLWCKLKEKKVSTKKAKRFFGSVTPTDSRLNYPQCHLFFFFFLLSLLPPLCLSFSSYLSLCFIHMYTFSFSTSEVSTSGISAGTSSASFPCALPHGVPCSISIDIIPAAASQCQKRVKIFGGHFSETTPLKAVSVSCTRLTRTCLR